MARTRKPKADEAKPGSQPAPNPPGEETPNPAPVPDEGGSGEPESEPNETEGQALTTLRALAQHICRIRNRRIMFGGSKDEVVANGAEAMCGLLVAEVLEFLRLNDMQNLPSQGELATMFSLNAGTYGQFLLGAPSRNKAWVRYARESLRHIVRVTTPESPERQEILDRLELWCFRDYDPRKKQLPRVFLPERARFSEPMTRTELAGEIEWYAFERELTGQPAKLIWVSGDSSFFPDSATGTVGKAVHDAIDAEVDVHFVFHGPSEAGRSLDEFFDHNGRSPSDFLHKIDLSTLGREAPARWWGFVNPVLQFLYLSVDGEEGGAPDETLFIIRGPESEEERRNRHGPLAVEGNKAELAAFRAWMNHMGL